MTDRMFLPVQKFIRTEAGGGAVLLAAAAVAFIWANSPWDKAYFDLWQTVVSVDIPLFEASQDSRHWVNDSLMVGFFLVVGLEIKREFLYGELATPRRAALPIAAALGGMVVPALLFASINAGGEGTKGWGIPMATDIAFALAVLAVLGRRIPSNLRVFLLALAIVDDIGAISVIAIFYTEGMQFDSLAVAATILAALVVVQTAGVRNLAVYLALGAFLWMAVFQSGVHATAAGVVLGFLVPGRPRPAGGAAMAPNAPSVSTDTPAADSGATGPVAFDESTPLARLEGLLHPWSAFVFVPLFALANSGVSLSGETIREAASAPVTYGVVLGLLVGKPVGVVGAVFIATRLGVGSLAFGVTWPHILGASLLAGIGFTMSLFITGLAFEDPGLAGDAKVAILSASVIAAIAGYVILRMVGTHGSAVAQRKGAAVQVTAPQIE
jgi:NhaA family Na+:H+ antiporter